MKTFAFIKDVYRRYPALCMVMVGLLLLVSLLEAAAILSLAPVVDVFLRSDGQSAGSVTVGVSRFLERLGLQAGLTTFLLIFLAFNILRAAVFIVARFVIFKIKYTVLKDMMVSFFRNVFNARWFFFTSSQQGLVINTMLRELTLVGDALGSIGLLSASALQIVLFLAVPLYVSWQVTTASVIAALLLAAPFLLLGKHAYRLSKTATHWANRCATVISEGLQCAKVVLGFGKQSALVREYADAFDGHRRAAVKVQTIRAAIGVAYFPLGIAVMVVALLTARKLMVPISEITIIFYSLIRIVPLISQIPAEKTALDSLFASYEQVTDVQNKAIEMRQPTGEKVFPGLKRELRLEDVSFSYSGSPEALRGISVTIPRGKMIAFTGESGSGKSTLLDLIMGFHRPDSGRIVIDGKPLSQYDIASYRASIGYVPQDSVLFNMTILENLRWADETAGDDDIQFACEQANAAPFIRSLPDGYDTVAGDRGVRLSGGQIQRIALARAILRKPDILIMDEATSSLDATSETLIQEAIAEIAHSVTMVVVAHRPSSIAGADHIYVLDRNGVAEEGTYEELCSAGGYVSRMAGSPGANAGAIEVEKRRP